jgi:expansin
VHGPDGSVRVEVIDQCPECGAGHIDLSEAAFSALAPLSAGIIKVTYQHLSNPSLPGSIALRVKEGSSRYWLALLAMNTGNPLASVQVERGPGDGWQDLVRANDNYWIAQSGAGPGPFTVRLTDTAGHAVTVRGITLSPGVVQDTGTWMYGGCHDNTRIGPLDCGVVKHGASSPAPTPARTRSGSPATRRRLTGPSASPPTLTATISISSICAGRPDGPRPAAPGCRRPHTAPASRSPSAATPRPAGRSPRSAPRQPVLTLKPGM